MPFYVFYIIEFVLFHQAPSGAILLYFFIFITHLISSKIVLYHKKGTVKGTVMEEVEEEREEEKGTVMTIYFVLYYSFSFLLM